MILICIRNFNYSRKFRFEPRKCLEIFCLSGLFCFDRFCLFFCILYFVVFCVVFFAPQVFSSCSLCIEVLGVFVSRLNMRIFICTNPLMRITMRFWCEGSFQVLGERMIWWDQEEWKAKAWGCPLGTSQHISRSLKHLNLGMPKASPSSSTKYHAISSETIF